MDSIERQRLREKLEARRPLDVDPHPAAHGVLLSDEISFYAINHKLIDPYRSENLKPAAYELTIGDEYFLSGEFHRLDATARSNDQIIIPPFEVAVLKTAEIICLPRFMIARWNIKVSLAYAGLLWVGGPQVDPGWVGNLFCPIYNLSDRAVMLKLGQTIAVIDFVKTTPYSAHKSKEYDFPPKRLVLQDYSVAELKSALFARAGRQLGEVETKVASLQVRFDMFTQLSFAIIALILALVLGSSSKAFSINIAAARLAAIALSIAIFGAVVSLFSYVDRWSSASIFERYGQLIGVRLDRLQALQRLWRQIAIMCFLVVAIIAGVLIYNTVSSGDVGYASQADVTKLESALKAEIAARAAEDHSPRKSDASSGR